MRLRLQYVFLYFALGGTMMLFLLKIMGMEIRIKQSMADKRATSSNLLLHVMSIPEPIHTKKSGNNSETPTKTNVKVLSRGVQGKWDERTDMCDVRPEFVRAHLKEPANTPIFVYDKGTDAFVSGSIIASGMWEGDLVLKIRDFLKEDKERVLLDLGSNVGVFSLMAAKNGYKVFSVDCLSENVHRLCASSIAGHFMEGVTIIHNALSDVRGNVTFGTYKGNVGGTYVKKLDGVQTTKDVKTIPAILLDDLLEIFKFKKVVIKMDLETFEENVIKGGEKFFSEAQVDYLLMEFSYHRTRPSGRSIIEILDRYGMTPMLKSVHDVHNLTDSAIRAWPGYVTWKRKSNT